MVKFDLIKFRAEKRFFTPDNSLMVDIAPNRSGLHRQKLDKSKVAKRTPDLTRMDYRTVADHHSILTVPSKLLGGGYYDLINANNFEKCMDTLVRRGLFTSINTAGIIESSTSKVVQLENTWDVPLEKLPTKQNYNHMLLFMANIFGWDEAQIRINSFGFMKKGEMFKMYGKSREMSLERNDKFCKQFGIETNSNLMRVEHKLNSGRKVRTHFKSNRLEDVLNCDKNVMGKFLEKTFVQAISPIYREKNLNRQLSYLDTNKIKGSGYDLQELKDLINPISKKHRTHHWRQISRAVILTDNSVQQSGGFLDEIKRRQAYEFNFNA